MAYRSFVRREHQSSLEKSHDGTNLAFGGSLDRHYHFKHVSLKAGSSTVKQAWLTHIKVNDSVAIISIKNFPIGLHVIYLYFPNTPRIRTRKRKTLENMNKGIKEFVPFLAIPRCLSSNC